MAHTEWLPGVRLRHFSPTCAVHIEDCEGWWLSGCRSSVAEHWPFTSLYFHLITSKFSGEQSRISRVLAEKQL